ncbi:type I polyketide synthase, partial [Streptomyces hainanensis]
ARLPWVLSARDPRALHEQAHRLLDRVERDPDLDPTAIGLALATTRSALEHRAVLHGRDRAELVAVLTDLAAGRPNARLALGANPSRPDRTALLFTGQGAQRPGMGRELHDAFPAFAEAFDEACAAFDGLLPSSPRDAVLAADGTSGAAASDDTGAAQPALFAYETALYRLWRSRVPEQPDFLIGHSLGEITAAHVSGVLSLADAARLVAARATLMAALPAGGAMTAIAATEEEVAEELTRRSHEGTVVIAAINGPTSVVVSGVAEAVTRVAETFAARGRRTSQLRVSHAFHSPLMEPMLDDFAGTLRQLTFAEPSLPVVTNLTGRPADHGQLTSPEYWLDQVRRPVRFHDGIRTLRSLGVTTFVEIGPDAVLTADLGESHAGEDRPTAIATQRRGGRQVETFANALTTAFLHGLPVDWAADHTADARTPAALPQLPGYAFQRDTYALMPSTARRRERLAAQVADWRYRIRWEPIAVDQRATLSGRWLVAADPRDPLTVRVVDALRRHGATVTSLDAHAPADDRGGDEPTGRPWNAVRDLAAGPGGLSGVVSLLAAGDMTQEHEPAGRAAIPARVTGALGHDILLVQALEEAGVRAPLWWVTRGAVSVDAEPVTSLVGAASAGLGRVVGLERPAEWGGLVDLPHEVDDRALDVLAGVIAATADEDQVAVRDDGPHARRLARADDRPPATPFRPSGTALITGGTGGLGGHVARWLAREGTRDLVLLSRRGPAAPGADRLRTELEAMGATVTTLACDVADRTALAAVLDRLRAEGRTPRTVVHAAGRHNQVEPVTVTDPATLADVIDAKVGGALLLDELLVGVPLDAFVLFSSGAGVWGGAGQGPYAAANAFLDALAERRRAAGRPATAVAWGIWAGDGMAKELDERAIGRLGLRAMEPEHAVVALGQALAGDDTTVTVADVEWTRFAGNYRLSTPRRLIAGLVPRTEPDAVSPDTTVAAKGLRERLAALPEAERRVALLDLVLQEVAAELGHRTTERIDPHQRFQDLGTDSMAAIGIRDRLNRLTGLTLTASLIYDNETPSELASFLTAGLARPRESTEGGEHGSLAPLYRRIALLGRSYEGETMLDAAATLRATFDSPEALDGSDWQRAGATRLSEGASDAPLVIAFPPVGPVEPSVQYARLSSHLRGGLDLSVVTLPGFRETEPLPARVDTLARVLAEAALRHAGGRTLALLGYSSGGWFAHRVARELEAMGSHPVGVVLLDTYQPDGMALRMRKAMNYELIERRSEFVSLDYPALTAFGRYRVLHRGWRPEPVRAPTLFVRPSECVPGNPDEPTTGYDGWRATWPLDHELSEVPGDHCTMVSDHADMTAEVVRRWLLSHTAAHSPSDGVAPTTGMASAAGPR